MNKYLKSAVIMVGIFIALIAVGLYFRSSSVDRHTTKSADTVKPKPIKPKKSVESVDMTKALELINSNSKVDISVAVYDLKNNKLYELGSKQEFTAASTTKVIVAAAYLHQVEAGKRSLEQKIGKVSAETHIKNMINLSDNNSWDVLKKSLTPSVIQNYAKSVGLARYKFYGNKITAKDQTVLLTKLYKQELLNEENTNLLLSYMTNTNNMQMIPAASGENKVYNKYGYLTSNLHDTGIIAISDRPVVLAIYTDGPTEDGYYIERVNLIREIAGEVIDSFSKK